MALASLAWAAPAYPTKPIRLVAGFPPGGGVDIVARLFSPRLGETLGQQVVVENRPGATGTLAANVVAKATPDGYTILFGSGSTNLVAPLLYSKLPYDWKRDLSPVVLLTSVPVLISVTRTFPISSVRELIDSAKSDPNKLSYPSAGNGSTVHIAGEMFKMMAGVNLLHVPYQGAGQSVPDLIAGRVQVSFDSIATIIPHVRADKLRAIAVASHNRFPLLPDVPTGAEAGLPGYEISSWSALFVPAGTPASACAILRVAALKVRQAPDFKEKLLSQFGAEEMGINTPVQLQTFIDGEIAKYTKVVKTARMKID